MTAAVLTRPEAAVATPRAAVYCRVSTRGQEERGYSLDGQLAECRELAAEISAEIVAEWREQQSGADWDRPKLLECLEQAKAGAFDVLFVYDTSRLARDVGLLLYVGRQLDKAGVEIRYVRETFDNSPSGQFQKQIKGAVDAYIRADLALRFAMGKLEWTALLELHHSEASIFTLTTGAASTGMSVSDLVARAVYEAAYACGAARRERKPGA